MYAALCILCEGRGSVMVTELVSVEQLRPNSVSIPCGCPLLPALCFVIATLGKSLCEKPGHLFMKLVLYVEASATSVQNISLHQFSGPHKFINLLSRFSIRSSHFL